MSDILIQQYYTRLEKVIQYGGSYNETAIRNAFYILLNSFCESKNFELIPEFSQKDAKIRPDGTVKDRLCQDIGYWESKGPADNLDARIQNKFDKGYPAVNILFENSDRAVLFQKGVKIMDVPMKDAKKLDEVLSKFLSYKSMELLAFYDAIEKFSLHLPNILTTLREKIAAESQRNPQFQQARDTFLTLCRNAVNPTMMPEDVREMMIQHILTEEIFLSVFNESMFHRENNIARELDKVVSTFFTGEAKHHTLDSIENYYLSIKRAASNIANHNEKQKFLKALYENFYRIYNPKAADRLGIFYTPNEIVRFMIESTDYLLNKCFGKLLSDPGVQILDPAAGTGTFVTELIDYLPKSELPHKYREDIHCSEVSILPYYIANLNIEFTYKQKMGKYSEFKNICLMDTLDHSKFSRKQSDMYSMTVENTDRINRQNQHEIFVVIGNPPYNANQQNENENNKNREYDEVDKRIKATYIRESTAQKTKLYDMYSRFFRWATDRIGDKEGIVAFITNSSFIDARTFDGFRKVVSEEFDEIHIVDLGGNVRKKETSNIFGIKLGVAVSFMIKYRNRRDSLQEKHKRRLDESPLCRIYYYHVPEFETAKEKLNFLATAKFADFDFQRITPDENHNWINITDNDFDDLLPLANKETKSGKAETAVFKISSNGLSTNRDEWVYDFSQELLEQKSKFFIEEYNREVERWIEYKALNHIQEIPDESNPVVDGFLHARNIIKWSKMIKRDKFRKEKKGVFDKSDIRKAMYRPFVFKYLYFNYISIDLPAQQIEIFPESKS
ncbi:MAG: DNA methyltransferase, partial [Desulfobacteraceae bacterium IS3]